LLIDPVEKDFMFDARTRREVSPAYFHVRNAIELADINGPIFVETGRGRMVLPLEACRWFAASPLYRGFVTPSLLDFFAPSPPLPLPIAGPEPAPPPDDKEPPNDTQSELVPEPVAPANAKRRGRPKGSAAMKALVEKLQAAIKKGKLDPANIKNQKATAATFNTSVTTFKRAMAEARKSNK
jgi:hypothetical protein